MHKVSYVPQSQSAYVFWASLVKHTPLHSALSNLIFNFFFEFVVTIVPPLLSCTVLSEHSVFENLVLFGTALAVSVFLSQPHASEQPRLRKKRHKQHHDDKNSDDEELDELLVDENTSSKDETRQFTREKRQHARKPFLSAYRAGLLVLTCLAILAVDFDVFPRRFAKVETYGTSLVSVLEALHQKTAFLTLLFRSDGSWGRIVCVLSRNSRCDAFSEKTGEPIQASCGSTH
jgi:hypothetical protein